jgi:hypothetical protein
LMRMSATCCTVGTNGTQVTPSIVMANLD